MFFYLCKVLFSVFLQFKGYFIDGQSNSKYRDEAPLKEELESNLIASSRITQQPQLFPLGSCVSLARVWLIKEYEYSVKHLLFYKVALTLIDLLRLAYPKSCRELSIVKSLKKNYPFNRDRIKVQGDTGYTIMCSLEH